MNYPFWIAIGLLMLGLYTMIAHQNLFKKFVGMSVFQTAIILFFMLTSVKRGADLPIVSAGAVGASGFMNPLPHALMLTAIVVAVATAGLALGILIRLHATYGSLEEDVIAAGPAPADAPPAPGAR